MRKQNYVSSYQVCDTIVEALNGNCDGSNRKIPQRSYEYSRTISIIYYANSSNIFLFYHYMLYILNLCLLFFLAPKQLIEHICGF